MYESVLRMLPMPVVSPNLLIRTLLINCLTRHYADLWRECWDAAFATDRWTKCDPRLRKECFSALTPDWSWHTTLRTDYETGNVQAVLDGDLDGFMESWLRWRRAQQGAGDG